jgi:hypothetical protein
MLQWVLLRLLRLLVLDPRLRQGLKWLDRRLGW